MIVVTGAAGFISSCLVGKLNELGHHEIVVVDDFSKTEKEENLMDKTLVAKVPRTDFINWLEEFGSEVSFIFHLGARTDTAEFDIELLNRLNLDYSKDVWKAACKFNIPLVYASSAATYGLGEFGYSDAHDMSEKLKPLNPYGDSKNDFDKWVLAQESTPPFWAGLKFFNVYGPNEYHKGRMASVILHAFRQISETNAMKLFASHNPDYKNGEQLRDFVYVKDVVNVCKFLFEKRPESGIYNLGTGTARTFLDLTKATFKALGKEADISFVPTPEDIRDKYQYFTEADMTKLLKAGYSDGFHTLEEGVADYVGNYLKETNYL
jgi:ADP-L-glycero-D-manno-heptose 6-epimerase